MQNLKKDFLIYTAFLASKNIPYAQDVMFDQFEGVPNLTQDDMQYLEQIATDQKLYIQVGQNFRKYINNLLKTETDEGRKTRLVKFVNELNRLGESDDYKHYQIQKN